MSGTVDSGIDRHGAGSGWESQRLAESAVGGYGEGVIRGAACGTRYIESAFVKFLDLLRSLDALHRGLRGTLPWGSHLSCGIGSVLWLAMTCALHESTFENRKLHMGRDLSVSIENGQGKKRVSRQEMDCVRDGVL